MFLQVPVITVKLPGGGGIFLVVQGTSAGWLYCETSQGSFMVVPAGAGPPAKKQTRSIKKGISASNLL